MHRYEEPVSAKAIRDLPRTGEAASTYEHLLAVLAVRMEDALQDIRDSLQGLKRHQPSPVSASPERLSKVLPLALAYVGTVLYLVGYVYSKSSNAVAFPGYAFSYDYVPTLLSMFEALPLVGPVIESGCSVDHDFVRIPRRGSSHCRADACANP